MINLIEYFEIKIENRKYKKKTKVRLWITIQLRKGSILEN